MAGLRQLSIADHALHGFQQRVRLVTGSAPPTARAYPATSAEGELTPGERAHAASLMRVNHAGEICAQALYDGQALTARGALVKTAMQDAAAEELDHLDWCQRRIGELGGRTSHLAALYYVASFAAGATAGALGDRVNLGFLAATEEEVSAHLDRHLEALPDGDHRSAEILEQMREDERKHATTARDAGALTFARPVLAAMRAVSRVMTSTAYRI